MQELTDSVGVESADTSSGSSKLSLFFGFKLLTESYKVQWFNIFSYELEFVKRKKWNVAKII